MDLLYLYVCMCVCLPKHIWSCTFFLSSLNTCSYVLRGVTFTSERESVIFACETAGNSRVVVGCYLLGHLMTHNINPLSTSLSSAVFVGLLISPCPKCLAKVTDEDSTKKTQVMKRPIADYWQLSPPSVEWLTIIASGVLCAEMGPWKRKAKE